MGLIVQCHLVCSDAAASICLILETYESTFGLRKLASTCVYSLFTAACVYVANSASAHPELAADARRRLQQVRYGLSPPR